MSSSEEKLINIEILRAKYNDLTSKERLALYHLKKRWKNIVIKGADKGCSVAVLSRKDYIKETENK